VRAARAFHHDELGEPVQDEDAGLLEFLVTYGNERFDDLFDVLSRDLVSVRLRHRF
jgi:hypothetical protein